MIKRLSLRITSQSTMQIVGAFVFKQVHDLWNALERYSSYDYYFESRHKTPCRLQLLL